MAVTKRVRFEVLRRDNHTCRYCGASAPDATLTVDHVTPVALGGSDDPSNLVAACKDCNAGKASTSPDSELVEDVAQDALRWAAAMREAARIKQTERDDEREYVAVFLDEWDRYRLDFDRLPPDFDRSIIALRTAGLPEQSLTDIVGIVATARNVRDRFSYCMGVAWKRVGVLQEMATELLAAEEGD